MPKHQPKKTTHKKSAHTKKKAVPTSVQKDIADAVNSLPSLLVDQHTLASIQSKQSSNTSQSRDSEPPQQPSMLPPSNAYQPPQHSGVLLVTGVALLMCTILGLWAWNMQSMVTNVFAAPSAEKKILANVGDDFSDIIDNLTKQDSISAKLDELQSQTTAQNAPSTTPSTTAQSDIKAALYTILSTTTTSTP